MANLVVTTHVDSLPDYVTARRYFGLITSAAPVYDKANPPSEAEASADAEDAMRLWHWTWYDFVAVEMKVVDGKVETVKLSEGDVTRLNPGEMLKDEAKDWLDARFTDYLAFARGNGGVVRAVTLTKEDAAKLDDVGPWVQGFVANLTAVMAPVPQHGQLAHVAWVAKDEVPRDEAVHLAFVPVFKFAWNGVDVVVDEDAIEDAVENYTLGLPFERELRLKLTVDSMGTKREVVLECGAIETKPDEPPLSGTLWSEVELRLGSRRLGQRAIVGTGFDLLEPGLRGLDDFAVIPEPLNAFALGSRLIRDHVLPTAATIERVLKAVAGGESLGVPAQDLKKAYQDFVGVVTAPGGFGAWRDAITSASPAIAEALTRWTDAGVSSQPRPRGFTVLPEPGFPTVSMAAMLEAVLSAALGYGWSVSQSTLTVHATPDHEKYQLQRWSMGTWTSVGPHLSPAPWVGSAPAQFELTITDVVKAGLRAGRHQLIGLDPYGAPTGSIVARFALMADEEGLAPIRRLVSALGTEEDHVGFVIALLRQATKAEAYKSARDYLASIETQLRNEILPREAGRRAIREDNLGKEIVDAVCGPITDFAAGIKKYRDYKVLADLAADGVGLPTDLVAAFKGVVTFHADHYLIEALPVDGSEATRITTTPEPLEIELEQAAVQDRPATFDNRADPDDDPFAAMAGAGVLLRREGDSGWRCLNAAKLTLAANTVATGPAAMPIAYEDGIAAAALRYKGEPIAIEALFAPNTDDYALESAEPGPAAPAVARYELITNGDIDQDASLEWSRPPLLAEGKTYEACGFFIHQSGALPKEIARADAPWLLDPDTLADTAVLAGTQIRAKPAAAKYLRTIPIGAPRIEGRAAENLAYEALTGSTFAVPAGVVPLARELPRTALTSGGPGRPLFRSGLTGTLDLAGGPWSLTFEGIERRGFKAMATLSIEVRNETDWSAPSAFALLVDLTKDKVIVQVKIESSVTKIVDKAIDRPVTLELTVVPENDGSAKATVRARVWPADSGPSDDGIPYVFPDGKPLLPENAFLLVTAAGEAETEGGANIGFGIPRVETSRGARSADVGEAPVMLLAPDAKTFSGQNLLQGLGLRVRPPAVECDGWDRRAAAAQIAARSGVMIEKIRTHRANVLGGSVIGRQNGADQSELREPEDVEVWLDDPSVRVLLIEAAPLYARRSARAHRKATDLTETWLRDPAGSPKTVADLLMGGRVPDEKLPTVGIGQKAGGSFPLELTLFTTDACAQDVCDGEIWEVAARALVSPEEADGLSAAVKSLLVPFTYKGKTWLAGPPERVLVETATAKLPRFEEIRAALTAGVVGRSVGVSFDPGRLTRENWLVEDEWPWRGRQFAYLRKATLFRQMWRWTGRPLDVYPFASTEKYSTLVKLPLLDLDAEQYRRSELDRIGEALRWEVKAFGDRDQSDLVSITQHLQPMRRTSLRLERLDGDGRAQHWRFRLAAESRYAPILGASEVSRPSGPLHDLWQRAFVPVAPPEILRPPAPRVTLPLTDVAVAADDRRPPPLLTVLDDAWFDVGGVAEQLVVDIEEVSDVVLDPVTPKDETKATTGSLQEFGPDPIRSGGAWGTTPADKPFQPGPSVVLRPIGPIGYTYDEGASAPRFAHSSFVLDAGLLQGTDTPIPDWSFVKFSLRRLLAPEAAGDYKPPATSVANGTTKRFDCDRGGAAGFVDIDVAPGEAPVVLSLALHVHTTTIELPAPPTLAAAAKFRVTVERMAVGAADLETNRRETWRVDVLARDQATAADHHGLRRVSTVEVPVLQDQAPWLSVSGSSPSRADSAGEPSHVLVSDTMKRYHVSRPTPAKWAQLAADFSRFAEASPDGTPIPKSLVSADELVVEAQGNQWMIKKRADLSSGIRLAPYDPPSETSQLMSELWAVATERLLDAGRREIERYIALFKIEPGKTTLVAQGPAPTSGKRVVFRILEVERHRKAPAASGWAALWPDPADEATNGPAPVNDARARIVKVSRPIPSIAGS